MAALPDARRVVAARGRPRALAATNRKKNLPSVHLCAARENLHPSVIFFDRGALAERHRRRKGPPGLTRPATHTMRHEGFRLSPGYDRDLRVCPIAPKVQDLI